MNMTQEQYKTIQKALELLPNGEEFAKLSEEQKEIIFNANSVMVALHHKQKRDIERMSKYITNKRKENKNYGRGKSMYVRKTEDYWSIHSKYGVECNCSTYAEAKANKKDYEENVDYPVWIKKHRREKEN